MDKGRKLKKDSFKVFRLMQDMLAVLSKKPGLKGKLDRVQVFGALEQRNSWSLYSLKQKGGFSYLYQHTSRNVPSSTDATADGINKFLNILQIVVLLRQSICDLVMLVYPDDELPGWSDEEDDGTSATEEEPFIAHCHDTPKKKSSRAKRRQHDP